MMSRPQAAATTICEALTAADEANWPELLCHMLASALLQRELRKPCLMSLVEAVHSGKGILFIILQNHHKLGTEYPTSRLWRPWSTQPSGWSPPPEQTPEKHLQQLKLQLRSQVVLGTSQSGEVTDPCLHHEIFQGNKTGWWWFMLLKKAGCSVCQVRKDEISYLGSHVLTSGWYF